MWVPGKGPSAPGLVVSDPACFPRTRLYEASSPPGTWLSPQFNWCPDSSSGHVALEQEPCPGALGVGSLRLRYPVVSASLLAQMVKNWPAINVGDLGLIPGSGRSPWRREWQPTPVFLPGEFHGQRSLASYSPWGHRESDTTERLTFTE